MSARPRTPHAVEVDGPAGALETIVDAPQGEPRAIAVICHPHPLQQGTMHNKVVTTVARAFRRLGAAAVRFNFRGVGRSSGSHADGIGELADALAIVSFARGRWPGLGLYLGGFSFGGMVALAAASPARPRGLVTVAPAIAHLPLGYAPPDCAWLLVQGDSDDVVSSSEVLAWARAQSKPPEIALFPGVGHFFHGQLPALEERVTRFFAPDFAGTDRGG
jgi:hypothetical protein